MSVLLKSNTDGMSIPSTNSKETTLYAEVPKPEDDSAAVTANSAALMPTVTHASPKRDDTPPDTTSTPTRSEQTATTTDNVYLQVARALLIVVIGLSLAYLVYWVLQNVFGIDPMAKINALVEASPLSNLGKPLNALVATAVATSVAPAVQPTDAKSPTPAPAPEPTPLPTPPPLGNNASAPETTPIPSSTSASSLLAPLRQLLSQAPMLSSAPHKDGVTQPSGQYQGPLSAEGSHMKKKLEDKTVSALLDLMSQIQ